MHEQIIERMPILETKKIEKMLQTSTQAIMDKQKDEHFLMGIQRQTSMAVTNTDAGSRTGRTLRATPVNDWDLLALVARMHRQQARVRRRWTRKVRRAHSMMPLTEMSLADEFGLNIAEIVSDKYKTTDVIALASSTRVVEDQRWSTLEKKKIESVEQSVQRTKFSELVAPTHDGRRRNSVNIAASLREDLANLQLIVKSKEMSGRNDRDDEALLMVIVLFCSKNLNYHSFTVNSSSFI